MEKGEVVNRAEHTPGPWSINEWTRSDSDIGIGAIGTPLITVVRLRDVSAIEQKANARLIAAAPELLASLRRVVMDLESMTEKAKMTAVFRAGVEAHISSARELIAKATGGAL